MVRDNAQLRNRVGAFQIEGAIGLGKAGVNCIVDRSLEVDA
nr:hypothetical protein [Qipengyuania qiaonensis]